MFVVVGRAHFACIDHQLDDRVFACAGKACDGADRASLAKKVEDAGAFTGGELFHTEIVMHFALQSISDVDFVMQFALQTCMEKSEPLLFVHDHREWLAQKWATSDPSAPFIWKYRPAHPERGMPDLARYQAARAYFEKSIA